jgi:zinc finger CCCH domain-containing protein 13
VAFDFFLKPIFFVGHVSGREAAAKARAESAEKEKNEFVAEINKRREEIEVGERERERQRDRERETERKRDREAGREERRKGWREWGRELERERERKRERERERERERD